MRLSKSSFLRGLQCPKSLWLRFFRPDLAAPASPGLQHILAQGRAVGELARRRFPGGVLVTAGHDEIPEALRQTQAALKTGALALFEPAFVYDDALVRPDVLVRTGSAWDLIEVKAATEIKDVYLSDVAIQRYVLEGAGLPVRSASLLLVDTDYVRRGALDPERFFRSEDVTQAIGPLLAKIPAWLASQQAALSSREAPGIEVGPHCSSPHGCDFYDFCWKHVPDYSVYDLKRADFATVSELRQLGVMRLEDIPEDFGLTDAQEVQVRVAKTGEPHVDAPRIRAHLAKLAYPRHFLDFETVNLALPPYDGVRPFQALPFQASLHVVEAPGAEPRHLEYLADPRSDPRPGLVEFLVRSISGRGSVVVYNESFEGGRLCELAAAFPEQARPLTAIKQRLWDLIVPFRTSAFAHPDMHGSASMKAVLPALVPGMSYESLAIPNGEMAFLAYEALMTGQCSAAQTKRTLAALREYCGQDTLGMVEILRVLEQAAA